MASPKSTTIYTKEGCPFCTKIKAVWNEKGWNYSEYKLDENTQSFIGHAMALFSDESYLKGTAKELVKRLHLYAYSLNRCGTSTLCYSINQSLKHTHSNINRSVSLSYVWTLESLGGICQVGSSAR